jgi:hypothetical protein
LVLNAGAPTGRHDQVQADDAERLGILDHELTAADRHQVCSRSVCDLASARVTNLGVGQLLVEGLEVFVDVVDCGQGGLLLGTPARGGEGPDEIERAPDAAPVVEVLEEDLIGVRAIEQGRRQLDCGQLVERPVLEIVVAVDEVAEVVRQALVPPLPELVQHVLLLAERGAVEAVPQLVGDDLLEIGIVERLDLHVDGHRACLAGGVRRLEDGIGVFGPEDGEDKVHGRDRAVDIEPRDALPHRRQREVVVMLGPARARQRRGRVEDPVVLAADRGRLEGQARADAHLVATEVAVAAVGGLGKDEFVAPGNAAVS